MDAQQRIAQTLATIRNELEEYTAQIGGLQLDLATARREREQWRLECLALRKITTIDNEMVERAAKAFWESVLGLGGVPLKWDRESEECKQEWRKGQRVALEAALQKDRTS